MTAFKYDGRVYVRPVGRGVHLLDLDWDCYLEDVAPEGYHRMRVSFEPLTGEDEQAAIRKHKEPRGRP